jgi:hypothetical protein
VLASASRDRGLFTNTTQDLKIRFFTKVRFSATPKPARETRALPGKNALATMQSIRHLER